MPPSKRLHPRKTPRQERSRETVAAILDAAAQVFEAQGYDAGTTDRIAERAGVSVGTLYQYFPSKDAVLVRLAARHLDQATAFLDELMRQARLEQRPIRELLERLVRAVVHEHRDGANLHRVLFEHGPMPAALAPHREEVDTKIRERVRELLLASPEVTVADLDCAAFLVVEVVDLTVHRYLLHSPETVSLDTFVANLVDMLVGYLTPRPPSDRPRTG